tara:strand:- start:326 stop:550 length:225 start_codon:yes stop_codon:yes gene_type:complete
MKIEITSNMSRIIFKISRDIGNDEIISYRFSENWELQEIQDYMNRSYPDRIVSMIILENDAQLNAILNADLWSE